MKVGSLVVFLGCNDLAKHTFIWLPKPKEDVITIRSFDHNPRFNETIAYFEEGIVGYNSQGQEVGIPLRFLQEVQTKDEWNKMLDEILESQTCEF